MSSEPAALRIQGLNHAFGNATTSRPVLRGIDLDLGRGMFMMLMGPSGCGKTTMLTLAAGLRAVQSGRVRTLGIELGGATEATRIAVRRQIGFVFQMHNLHGSLTAEQNVRMALEARGQGFPPDWRTRCRDALAAVGLADRATAYPASLSTGQKQRVAIARAVVANPPLIIADEPTAALDRASGRQAVALLRALAAERGSAVLMVTHDNRVVDLADCVVAMDDGHIVTVETDVASA